MKISLRTKMLGVVLILAVTLAAAAIGISYYVYGSAMDTHYKSLSRNVARSTASVLDAELVSALTAQTLKIYRAQCPAPDTAPDFESFADEDWAAYYKAFEPVVSSEAYQKVYAALLALRDSNEVKSLYLCYLDLQTGQGIYLVDASDPVDACNMGYCDELTEENAALIAQGKYDIPAYITNYPEYGWLSSSATGVTDAQGQVVASIFVDISMNDVINDRYTFLAELLLVLVLVTVILACVLGYAATRTIVQPINRLLSATASFVADKQKGSGTAAYIGLDFHTGDEIEHLADSFQTMERELNTYIADLASVTAEKERIGTELNIATKIQADMLPYVFPPFPDRPEFDIYATMHPAKEVGGDFYDFFMVDERHIAIVVADVSGKGVPAALFMVIGKTLIKDHTVPGADLGAVFTEVNNLLCESNSEGMFITAFEGVLDLVTGEFRFVNAGHEMPFWARRGEPFVPQKLRAGFVLAGMKDMRYRSGSFQLEPGDRIFQYTDGVTEATNAQNELFGMERLGTSLNKRLDDAPAEILAGVKADVDAFVVEAPQFDDITMLCLEYKQRMSGEGKQA